MASRLYEVLEELQRAGLITSEECKGVEYPFEVIGVQSAKTTEVVSQTSKILKKHGWKKESKFLPVLAELRQTDLITGEECEELIDISDVIEVQSNKSNEVVNKSSDVMNRHRYVQESNLLPVLAELRQADLVASEECRELRHIIDVVAVQRTKSPEVMTATTAVMRRHGYDQESILLLVLAELQQSKLVASEECSMLSHIVDVVSVQITKSPEVMTETAAVLRRHELGKESKLLSVLADLQQADLITSEECSRLSHISRVLEVQRTKSPEVVTKTADVIKRHGYVQESSLLPVLADLQQAHLITADEYTWLNDISGVVKLQITKSHEVMTETAAVMKRHGLGEESKLLSVLADLRQAGLITSDECRELSSIGRVVAVQHTKSPEVRTKIAAVLRRHELGEESSLLPDQDLLQFEERYSRAVSTSASVALTITKCTTIGPPRKGKTCLKYLLTGREWNEGEGTASTDVMEAPEWVECYGVGEGGAKEKWELLTPEEQQGELLRAVNSLTSSESRSTAATHDAPPTTELRNIPPSTSQDPTTPLSDDLSTNMPESSEVPLAPTGEPHSVIPESARPSTTMLGASKGPATVWGALNALACACTPEVLRDILSNNEGRILGKTDLIHFIDTGGQAVYHDVHPVLITSPSVYLVVFNLNELYIKQKNRDEQLDYFRSDLIQRPLRSIYTFGMKTPRKENYLKLHSEAPKILIVGTHLDKIPLEESGVTREQFLQELSEMIKKEIRNKPYRQFVQFDTNDRSFWAVDNTKAGKEQDGETKEYIATLRGMVHSRSMEMSVKVPLPWMLLKMVMEGKGVRYCTYSELMKEALVRGYVSELSPDADLVTMLRLFHTLGLIYHKEPTGYKKEDSLVFINPDCLYSATSDFLMAAKEEIEESSRDQHQAQAATTKEKYNQGGANQDHHQTQSSTLDDGEVAGKENGQQLNGIVQKKAVLERVQSYSESIQLEIEGVLKIVEEEALLGSLLTKLKEIEQQYMPASRESQDVSTMKDKQQLFIRTLVCSLVTAVKAVLNDSEGEEEADVKTKLDKIVKSVRARYEKRSIQSRDMDQLLSILSDLRIIARLSDSHSYVVPAALPKVHHGRSVEICGSAASILVTVVSQTIMEECYLPSGLFCSLISELVTDHDLHWTVIPFEYNHVVFTHKDLAGRVHIRECESYIRIDVESQKSLQNLSETCQSVRKSIHKSIARVYSNLYRDQTTDSTFEESLVWGFQCEVHPDDQTHIAAFRKRDNFGCWTECLLEPWEMQDVEPKQLMWFSSELNLE